MTNSPGTLEKALDLLCLFTSEHLELSASEIAEKLNMPLSSTYKYLQAFQKRQFLSKNERSNKYYLSLTILKLGLLAAEKASVIETASPHLNALVDRSLETAFLMVPDGLNVICADVRESPRVLKITTRRGSTLPLYAGSPGKAVLAFKDQSFIDRLIETTGLAKLNMNTITDIEQMKEELAAIRRLGYSQSDSEYVSDVSSVAAPIFDYTGQVIASVALAGPAERIFGDNQQRLVDLVKESARDISSKMGYSENLRKAT